MLDLLPNAAPRYLEENAGQILPKKIRNKFKLPIANQGHQNAEAAEIAEKTAGMSPFSRDGFAQLRMSHACS